MKASSSFGGDESSSRFDGKFQAGGHNPPQVKRCLGVGFLLELSAADIASGLLFSSSRTIGSNWCVRSIVAVRLMDRAAACSAQLLKALHIAPDGLKQPTCCYHGTPGNLNSRHEFHVGVIRAKLGSGEVVRDDDDIGIVPFSQQRDKHWAPGAVSRVG
jgi:hypothetical protein